MAVRVSQVFPKGLLKGTILILSVVQKEMRILKRYFTKGERRFIRFLQENHIPFKSKVIIKNREVDFIIGKYAIEIDGHPQDGSKNEMLVREGYTPIHINNSELNEYYKFPWWNYLNGGSSNRRRTSSDKR